MSQQITLKSVLLYLFCLLLVTASVFGFWWFTAAEGVWWSALLMTVAVFFLPQGGITMLIAAVALNCMLFQWRWRRTT